MIKAKIVGAGGYGGVGITELLTAHPEAEISALVDVTDIGSRISDLYPHLSGYCDMPIVSADDPDAQAKADVVFMATPDGVGMKLAGAELEKGGKVVDYSGDFRFNDAESYAEYASRIGRDGKHAAPELLKETVYGLPELHRAAINSDVRVLGNPGCFAVSCILGLAPAVSAGLVEIDCLICDCKTGVSGAGKKASAVFHYPARYENMNAYKLTGHQHVFEIERELGLLANDTVTITFTSQVVPVCRGILSSLYGRMKKQSSYDEVLSIYREFYRDSMFVAVYDRTAAIGTIHVRASNTCRLTVDIDERTGCLRVISHIDNLVKGQAGSALQNMNLLFGFPENMGFENPPKYP